MNKLCDKCNVSIAVWHYAPSPQLTLNYFCDDCVPRGCSCNINYTTGEESFDEQGRQLPCIEYDYSEEGFDET